MLPPLFILPRWDKSQTQLAFLSLFDVLVFNVRLGIIKEPVPTVVW